MTRRGAGAAARDPRVALLCRRVFDFRLVVLLITVMSLFDNDHRSALLVAGILVATATTAIPVLRWERIAPMVMRHPLFITGDLIAAVIVLSVTGAGSPFFYFTLSTALLCGVLYGYRGAFAFTPFLVLGYLAGIGADGIDDGPFTFHALVGAPSLYVLLGVSGAAARRLLESQIRTEAALRAAVSVTTIERERARLAREMHDSLAKTLHGLALQARALSAWVNRDPERVLAGARAIEEAASVAAHEGRTLIEDLRGDVLDAPFGGIVREHVERWARDAGAATSVEVEEDAGDGLGPEARWELLQILREALTNVELHAGARHVDVSLGRDDGRLVLSVRDDGRGFPPERAEARRREGHFGLVGMRERAARAGGELRVESVTGRGTVCTARVPLREAEPREVRLDEERSPA